MLTMLANDLSQSTIDTNLDQVLEPLGAAKE
jgi:hypothetical protein